MKKETCPHVIFIFSTEMVYPPDNHNSKVFYISQEILRRGGRVTWMELAGSKGKWEGDGLRFVKIPASMVRFFGPWIDLIRLIKELRKVDARCVYADDWLFLRGRPSHRIFVETLLKVLGIGFVYDQRDPYIDFQIATGALKEDSMEERKIIALHHLEAMWTDLSVFPSEVYHKDMVLRGLSARRGLGVVRGVDINAFNPDVQGEGIREALGIEDRFVVGWFGMMTSYRLIEEVLIPLIESVDVSAPDVHFIIGGSGELMQAFKSLKERRPDVRMTLLGHVPHQDLPRYLAACELLLCPLNTNNLFSSNASPLKILEALAVGRPVIATSVKVRYKDFSELRGIVWTGKTLPEFIGALTHVRERYPELRATAEAQARDFDRFSTKSNISKIVDGIESVCK